MTLTAARAIRAFTITIFALVVLPLQAATPDTKIPAAGPGHAAIASAYPLASEAGKQILAKGGNAFDAAVAVASALTVVESCCSGLGGGGFFLLRRASDGHETMIDLREMAPGASTRGEEVRQVAALGEHGAGHQARARRFSFV
jgi:gamma-glutamyltranspeptidase/glutathione hydrolase